MLEQSKRGAILFIVLGIILVAATLATVMLRVVANQSRLTHHQVSRIQAQYAAKAGAIYALDKLRRGDWAFSPVNSCPTPGGCVWQDLDFPSSVKDQQFRVVFCPSGQICPPALNPCSPPLGYDFCINSTVDFSYTP